MWRVHRMYLNVVLTPRMTYVYRVSCTFCGNRMVGLYVFALHNPGKVCRVYNFNFILYYQHTIRFWEYMPALLHGSRCDVIYYVRYIIPTTFSKCITYS